MKGRKINGLYVLNGQTTVRQASVTNSSEYRSKVWHLRLGHMSERALKEIQKKGVFEMIRYVLQDSVKTAF